MHCHVKIKIVMLKQKAIKEGTAKTVSPFPYAYKTLI